MVRDLVDRPERRRWGTVASCPLSRRAVGASDRPFGRLAKVSLNRPKALELPQPQHKLVRTGANLVHQKQAHTLGIFRLHSAKPNIRALLRGTIARLGWPGGLSQRQLLQIVEEPRAMDAGVSRGICHAERSGAARTIHQADEGSPLYPSAGERVPVGPGRSRVRIPSAPPNNVLDQTTLNAWPELGCGVHTSTFPGSLGDPLCSNRQPTFWPGSGILLGIE